MTIDDITGLVDYGYWANARLIEVVTRLTPEQFTETVAGSYGSIRNTLVHVMSAEAGWLERCGGPKRGPQLRGEDYPTVASLVEAWRTIEANFRAFAAGLEESDLIGVIDFSLGSFGSFSLRLGEMLQHVANHGTHHRGQIALLLRALGHAPGNVDMLFYFAAKGPGGPTDGRSASAGSRRRRPSRR